MYINELVISGNLTRDPQLRYTPQGVPVCELRLANNTTPTKDRSGRKIDGKPVYVDVVCWRAVAEAVNKYVIKGQLVVIVGRLDYEQWQDRETGQRRSRHRIVAYKVQWPFAAKGKPKDDAGEGAEERPDTGGNWPDEPAGGFPEDRDDVPPF